MIQVQTELQAADNSGAQIVECIKVLGASRRRYAYLGDVIVVSVKKAIPNTKVKKGEIYFAVIVRVSKDVSRSDGTIIRFDDNAAILLTKQREPLGTRVFGPVARELRAKNFLKILSLAPEVL